MRFEAVFNNFFTAFALNSHILLVRTDSISDYCAKDICPYQGTHVRCNNDGSFSKNCTGDYKLEEMTPFIPLILNDHNMYRNIVAGGDLACFYPAEKMPILNWDWDLAYNAEYNAKTCVFGHDKCRSTSKFKYAGQNIYYTKTNNIKTPIHKFIEEAIFLWFEEYLDADYRLMEAVHKTEPQTGHLTVLINDHQDHVGCALLNNLQYTLSPKRMIIFVCNYSSTNVKGKPAYKAGPPASACQKRNEKFPFLCEDIIDPNCIK